MIGTAAALLGSAVIGAGASAISSSKAVKSAAQTSQAATDASTALQNKALDTQQANTAVTRGAGDTATNALLERLGLKQGEPDYADYVRNNPDLLDVFSKEPNAYGANGDIAAFGKAHWDTYGHGNTTENRTYTPYSKSAAPQEQARPDLVQTPGYQAPTLTQTPGYQAPTMADLDVSLGKYEKAPDYEWQQTEARRGTEAGAAATGSLRSGAAAKALQDRAQQIAYGDYTNWRNFTTGQYNTDRSYQAQQAQFGYNALADQNKFNNAAAVDAAQFGYNALANQNNATNQYQQQGFNTDRAFAQDKYTTGTNALFSLSGQGAAASGANNAAIGANANANSNALFSNASAQGNAALAGAGQVNSAINTGVNALGYYFGNKSGGQIADTRASVY